MCWRILKFLYSVKTGTKRRKEMNFKQIYLSCWMMKSNFNKFEMDIVLSNEALRKFWTISRIK